MPIRKSWFNIHFEMVFLFENNFVTLSQNSSENKVFKVFSGQSCEKWFYKILSLILGSISETCKQDFLWSILTPNSYL